MQITQHTAKID